jgi:hypothetical protein
MRELQLVEQSDEFGCGAAALAMVLGLRSQSEAEQLMGRECKTSHAGRGLVPAEMGVFPEEAQRVQFAAGIPSLRYVDLEHCLATDAWVLRIWDRVRIGEYDFLRQHLRSGGTAMLAVPALHREDRGHWIVVSGDKVFDPSSGKKYRAYSEIPKLLGAILIGPPSPFSAGHVL